MRGVIYTFDCQDLAIDIAARHKIWEVRRRVDEWVSINAGDVVVFIGSSCKVTTKITSIKRYDNFDLAFEELGSLLLPYHDGRGWDYYKHYYQDNSDVIAFGMEFVSYTMN